MTLLSAKLTPPTGGHILNRNRLLGIPGEGIRLIQITAGAGFGKTTLAAQFLARARETQAHTLWYRLDRFDQDFSLFMSYLNQGLALAGLDLPPAPAPHLADKERWLLDWLGALERGVNRPLLMVLDDFHQVSPHLNPILEFILDRLPPTVTLVLAGRRPPNLKISRLRAGLGVLDIGEGELAFTRKETQAFFEGLPPGGAAPPSQALAEIDLDHIQTKTRGWAAGLVLFHCAMNQSNWGSPLETFPDSREQVFAYLEENIFENQSLERREFMVKTALLAPLEPAYCDEILKIDHSKKSFQALVRDHLMVFPLAGDPPSFHYHDLLRDFLRAQARQLLGTDQITRLHLRAGKILARTGHALALHHYIEARAYDRAADLLSELEVQFLLRGKMPFVKACLDKIPDSVRDQHPQILFMAAKQHSYYGDSPRAITCLKQAHALFQELRDQPSAIKCLADLGAQYYYTGYIPEAKGLMEQVLDQVDPTAPTYILMMTYLVFFTAVLGKIELSQAYQDQTQEEINAYPPMENKAAQILISTSETYRLFITGRFRESHRLNRWLIQRANTYNLAACIPLARYQSAAADHCLGDYESGIAHARAGIKTANEIHLRDSQKGWLYLSWADNIMGLAQAGKASWAEAEDLIQKGLDVFQGPDNRWGQAHAWNHFARRAMHRKDFSQAHAHLNRAEACIQDRELDFPLAQIRLTRARVLVLEKKHETAQALLEELIPSLAPGPHFQALAQCLLLHCRSHSRPGTSLKSHGRDLDTLLAPGREPGWDQWVRHRLPAPPPNRGETKIPEINQRSHGAPSLKIQLLGPFALQVGDRKIPAEAWRHAPSLGLFKYLALHMDKGYLPKDLLLEILWPGEDPAKTGKRFNVAASRLRKLLEPDLPPKAPSAFLLRQRDQYRLSTGPGGRSDLDQFRTHAQAAKNATHPRDICTQCRAALDVYTGPLLEDTRYQDWCRPKREALAQAHLGLMKRLIHHTQEPDEALHWARQGIQADPLDETFHQTAMALLAAQGRYREVTLTFERCQAQLAAMDCPISSETTACFHRLMGKKNSQKTRPV
ncbi:MAG: hypothetical protein MI747_18760 [Desulfobacterales bacterium]|nr:hypothetical protein [Desulfobacterales bacterium]